MPWKNGGGHTLEVAISPPDAVLDSFDWRISMATVLVSGPFSRFQQTDRVLAVLDGVMILQVEGQAELTLSPTTAAHHFPGDVSCHAEVLSAVTDLNVMVRRGKFTATVRKLDRATVSADRAETFVLARTPVKLATGLSLEINDVLHLSPSESVAFEATPADAWLIEITSLASAHHPPTRT